MEQSSGHHLPLHPILADSSLHPQFPLGSSRKWGRKPRLPCGAGTHTGVSRADLRVVHGHPGLYWPEPRVIAAAHGVSSCLCPCSQPCSPLGSGQIHFQVMESPMGEIPIIPHCSDLGQVTRYCALKRQPVFKLLTHYKTAELQAAGWAGSWGVG